MHAATYAMAEEHRKGAEAAPAESVGDVLREILGDRPQRTVAREAGVDQATIHNLLANKRVSYDIAVRIAENLQLPRPLRRRFFTALRYADPLQYEPEWEDVLVQQFAGARDLPPEDLAALKDEMAALIAERRHKRGLD